MLNLEQIAERIEHPQRCSKEDIVDLQNLTEKYPYSQLFSILYLKSLSSNNDIRFDEELSKHAYRITDRAQLYRLIQDNDQPVTQVAEQTIEAKIIEPTVLEKVEEQIELPIKEEVLTPIVEIQQESIPVEEVHIPEIEIQTEPTPEVETIEIEEVNSVLESEVLTEPEIIEVETAENVAEEIIEIEEKNEVEETPVELESIEATERFDKELLSEAIVSNYNLDHLEDIEVPIEDNKEEKIEEKISNNSSITPIGKKSFSSWLRSNENEIETVDFERARIELIVDQFIKEEPSITRPSKTKEIEEKPKREFYSPAKKAKASLDVQSMPVSETLAKIFALQGNYPKAIYAYEQLILTNPEKKVFFASQIEELQKKLNIE